MSKYLSIEQFLELSKGIPVIDVRSPAEFEHGHIPGAQSIPLFSNEERAVVGTLYKHSGQKEALLKGLEIAGAKLRHLAEEGINASKDGQLLIHCWRGGMRSSSVAWLFETCGISCQLLKGGYKTYRRFLRTFFSGDFNLIVIGGMTGSGKTAILDYLSDSGYQVLKLEKLAHHKGSAFGRLGEDAQTTNEQFENDLFRELSSFDLKKPVFVEDESRKIGQNIIPPELYDRMSNSPLVVIEMDREIRIARLVEDYGRYSGDDLKRCVGNISKKLGGQNSQLAIDSINEGKFGIAAEIGLQYYDKTYTYGLSNKKNSLIMKVTADTADAEVNAQKILAILKEKNILQSF